MYQSHSILRFFFRLRGPGLTEKEGEEEEKGRLVVRGKRDKPGRFNCQDNRD